MELFDHRQEYKNPPIDVASVDPDPFVQFSSWFQAASDAEIVEPNAMVVSTVDVSMRPTSRTVLLKYFDEQGLVFFTNYGSRKARQIAENPNVSLLFPWYALQRQVEVDGVVSKVSVAESVKYFALRPRGSQLGAWVSEQSTVVSSRSLLQNKLSELTGKFKKGKIPKPDSWGGFRVRPLRFEFWQGGTNRLHDRIQYTRDTETDANWRRERLSP
jgi:pyridoxamine 5'-phosphate oxidase